MSESQEAAAAIKSRAGIRRITTALPNSALPPPATATAPTPPSHKGHSGNSAAHIQPPHGLRHSLRHLMAPHLRRFQHKGSATTASTLAKAHYLIARPNPLRVYPNMSRLSARFSLLQLCLIGADALRFERLRMSLDGGFEELSLSLLASR